MPAPRRAILANIHESKLDPRVAHATLDKSGKLVGSVIVKETKVKSTEKKHEPKEIHVNPVVVEKEAVLETTPEKIKTEIEVVQQEQPISEEVEKESVEIEKETSAETDVSLSSAKKKSKKKY